MARKTREKIMREFVEKGGTPPPPLPQRALPPLDLGGATTVRELDIDLVCNALIDGYSLRNIAAEIDANYIRKHGTQRTRNGKPSRVYATNVLHWIEEDHERVRKYEAARVAQADTYFSELFQLANEPVQMTMFGTFDTGAVQDKRLRIDAMKWIIAKLNSRKYGDRIDVTSANEPLSNMSPEQLSARLTALLNKARGNLPQIVVEDNERGIDDKHG